MGQEVEVKLSAGSTFSEGELLARLSSRGRIEGDDMAEQVDTYFDTEAAELAKAGLSARTRNKRGELSVEVKPVPIVASLCMARAELTAPVGGGEEVGDVLRRLLEREANLSIEGTPSPKAELRTLRRQLDYHEDELVAEVCIDRVRIHRPNGEDVDSFVEVEFELQAGEAIELEPLAQLGLSLGLQPSGRSKYLRAREALELPPYAYGAPHPVFDLSTPVDEVARAVCRHQFATMLSYESGTRVGLDTEHLHKMRVASRRLRTALRVFRKVLPADEVKVLSEELRWLGGRLGAVRDLDVHSLAFPTWRRSFAGQPPAGWGALEVNLSAHRERARAALLEALDSERYGHLLQRGGAAFAEGPGGLAPVRDKAGRLLGKRVERFHAGVDRFRETHAAEDAHQLRILGKRLRYTAEFLRPILGDSVRARVKQLGAFQDALGEVQDAMAAGAFAQGLLAEGVTDPEATFVLGLLVGSAATVEAHARPRVDRALEALDADTLLGELECAMKHFAHV